MQPSSHTWRKLREVMSKTWKKTYEKPRTTCMYGSTCTGVVLWPGKCQEGTALAVQAAAHLSPVTVFTRNAFVRCNIETGDAFPARPHAVMTGTVMPDA